MRKPTGKQLKIGAIALCASLICGFFAGFLSYRYYQKNDTTPKTFTADGMEITLTGEFSKKRMSDFTAAYRSDKVLVCALREDFSLAEGLADFSLTQYANLVLERAELSSTAGLKYFDKLTYFSYRVTSGDDTFVYYTFLYKASDAFWLVQFAVSAEDEESCQPRFYEWAASVSFS